MELVDGVDGSGHLRGSKTVSRNRFHFFPTLDTDRSRVQWPVITLKHDDIAKTIIARKTRDECLPNMTYQLSDDRKSITGVSVSAKNTQCGTSIPVTVPGDVSTATSATKERKGSDPLTLWVTLGGSAKTYNLASALSI
jgi:hypothetical protein